MNPKNAMKERKPINKMKEIILDFCKTQESIEIAKNNGTEFPIIEKVNYKCINGKHILLLVPVSRFINVLKDEDLISGMIFDKDGVGLKSSRRIYGNYKLKELSTKDKFLVDAVKDDKTYTKMLNHGAKFFELELIEGTAFYNGNEIYTLDKDYNVSFAKYSPSGKERFENSRKILMEYEGREVIFNVIIENGIYYTLTSATSNKVAYIKEGGICDFFDGEENTFSSKINILDKNKVQEIQEKLIATNNAFFKKTENLLALSFSK